MVPDVKIILRGDSVIKKEMIAMLLAGGQGSRLGVLTSKVAKPAVAFGGKYRIIDFPLSNCINSGVDTVGVLTQYQPLRLNTHIGIGIPWDLDRNVGGVTVLPPYEKSSKTEWYTGTANAIYQNLNYMETYNPEYVLILSGDHIYKMDYEVMLDFHKATNADVTIAVMPVPMEEASRFGIMVTDDIGRITEFEEKPEHPSSNLASMGIYIFNWQILKKYLIVDENNPRSENDFGKNVIPQMLSMNEPMYTYHFEDYWRDVGTVQSLWEAHMDMLSDPPRLDMRDDKWTIYSRNPVKPPHFISKSAVLKNCTITEGCDIYGVIEHSIISEGVTVEKGAIVRDSIIMPNAKIGEGAIVEKAIVGPGCSVGANDMIGLREIEDNPYQSKYCSDGIVLLEGGIMIDDNVEIGKNSMVENDIIAGNTMFEKKTQADTAAIVNGGA